MPLTKELIKKLTDTMGKDKTDVITAEVEKLLDAALACQLTGGRGVLYKYGLLRGVSQILMEPERPELAIPAVLATGDMLKYVEDELLSIMAKTCNCRLK